MRRISVERFSVKSSKTFPQVIAAFEKAVGHPEMSKFRRDISAAKNYAELEEVVRAAIGPSELMEFVRFDLGAVGKKRERETAQSLRFVVGNPLIMRRMVDRVPDAGSYAPVTILIDERPDGVYLSYDRMASFLASYGNSEALNVAQQLDAKVEALLTAAANEGSAQAQADD
jgi:uncharacterized protein (DUF302 family)